MKSGGADNVKGKLQRVKGGSKTEAGKLNDPTLEGKDENKIGRIQKKSWTRRSLERARRIIAAA